MSCIATNCVYEAVYALSRVILIQAYGRISCAVVPQFFAPITSELNSLNCYVSCNARIICHIANAHTCIHARTHARTHTPTYATPPPPPTQTLSSCRRCHVAVSYSVSDDNKSLSTLLTQLTSTSHWSCRLPAQEHQIHNQQTPRRNVAPL